MKSRSFVVLQFIVVKCLWESNQMEKRNVFTTETINKIGLRGTKALIFTTNRQTKLRPTEKFRKMWRKDEEDVEGEKYFFIAYFKSAAFGH